MPCSTPGCTSKKRVEDRGGGLPLCDACEAERQRAVDDVGSSGSDGEDEAQDGESDSEAGEQEHQIIVNELLCYAFTYIDSAAPEMVIKSIEQFYTGDEIHAAKDLLWQEYGKLLKNTESRRRGSVRTAASRRGRRHCAQLCNGDNEYISRVAIKFCALNLRRVPRFSPEELNLQSIVNRLSVVELHMQQVQEQTAHNSARLTVVEQDKGTRPARLYAARAARTSSNQQGPAGGARRSTPYLTRDERLALAQNRARSGSGNGASNASGTSSVAVRVADGETSDGVVVQPTATSRGAVERADSVTSSKQQGAKWETQRHERRKRIREATKDAKVVVGTKTNTKLQYGYDVKSIFVFNVNKKYDDRDISGFMGEAKVDCVKIQQISHKDATNKSFRVLIKVSDFDKVTAPEF